MLSNFSHTNNYKPLFMLHGRVFLCLSLVSLFFFCFTTSTNTTALLLTEMFSKMNFKKKQKTFKFRLKRLMPTYTATMITVQSILNPPSFDDLPDSAVVHLKININIITYTQSSLLTKITVNKKVNVWLITVLKTFPFKLITSIC